MSHSKAKASYIIHLFWIDWINKPYSDARPRRTAVETDSGASVIEDGRKTIKETRFLELPWDLRRSEREVIV